MEFKAYEETTFKQVWDFEHDFEGIKLFGEETDETEELESPVGWNGESIQYAARQVHHLGFNVTGFQLNDCGVIITAAFEKPISLFVEHISEYGDRISIDYKDGNVFGAIKGKLGNTRWVQENA